MAKALDYNTRDRSFHSHRGQLNFFTCSDEAYTAEEASTFTILPHYFAQQRNTTLAVHHIIFIWRITYYTLRISTGNNIASNAI